jgi:hypothetical protein
MKNILMLVLLVIPSLSAARVAFDNGDLIIAWLPPDQGNPLDHYIWTYTINGIEDSITGWSSARTTSDSSAVLTNVGDWAVFKIRAISIISDTSIQVISDTAVLLESQGIDTSGYGSISRPDRFGLVAFPNPCGQSGLTINWKVDRDDQYSVELFDILGAKLKTIRRERMTKGDYSQLVGRDLAAGVYFAVIKNRDESRVVKFTVLH